MYRNRKRSENDQYKETSNHRQMKGYDGSGGSPRPGGPSPGSLPSPLFICIWFDVSLYWSFSLRFLFLYISFYASNVYSTYIFRIGSSRVGLRQQTNQDFLIFRLLLNAFWHAGLRELVESFQSHQSDLKKVQSTSSYGQNIPKKEFWSQCCI